MRNQNIVLPSISGLTLPELLISLAVIGVIVTLISTFLIQGLDIYRLSAARTEIQRDARVSIDLLTRILRQGVSTSVEVTSFNSNQPPHSMIQFTHINDDQYRFYQSGDDFYVSKYASGGSEWVTNKIAENLRILSFTYPRTDEDSIVAVSFCFEKATYKGETRALQLSSEKIRIMN